MLTTTKVGHIVFTHDDQYRGEVEIVRGDVKITVPMDAIRRLAAESIRFDLADHVARMKPEALLRRIA